jgi:predicted Zn-dependent protease
MTGLARIVWRYAMGAARRRGRPDRGVHLALWYVRLRPQDPHAWLLLGRLLIYQGLFDTAAQMLSRGLTRHADKPEMWFWLSNALVSTSRLEEASRILEEARAEHPGSAWPYLGLADLSRAARRYKEAATYAKEAARSRGEDWEVAAIAGEILMQLPKEEKVAEELLREAADRDTRDRHAHLLLGVLLEERSPSESAEFLRAARNAPSPTSEFNRLLEQTRASLWKDRAENESES